MKTYLDLLREVRMRGTPRSDRTGTGTLSLFGAQTRYNLQEGFPLVTTKQLHLKSIVHELLWFIKGDTNVKYLKDNGVSIWDEWARDDGSLGPVYGHQWRNWKGSNGAVCDQLTQVISDIKTNPHSRRHIVSAWNVADLPQMALQPCHVMFQFYVDGNKLSLQLYQRSADVFLGVPFNIASYALLLAMVAQVTGLVPHEFIHTFGDVHLYQNHIDQADLQLTREPLPLPKLILDPNINGIEDFVYDSIRFENYQCHPKISAKVAV